MQHEHPEIFDRLSCEEIVMLLMVDGSFTLPVGCESIALRMAEARTELKWLVTDQVCGTKTLENA